MKSFDATHDYRCPLCGSSKVPFVMSLRKHVCADCKWQGCVYELLCKITAPSRVVRYS